MDPKLNKAAEEGDVMYLATRIVRIKRTKEEESALGIERINRTEEEDNRYGRCEDRCLLSTTQEGRNNILHLAAKAGHDLFVALALQFLPADLSNQLNSQGETPLLVAARFDHLNVVGTIKKPKITFQIRCDMAAGTTTLIGTYSSGSSRHVEQGLAGIELELGTTHDKGLVRDTGTTTTMYAELYKAAKEGNLDCLSGRVESSFEMRGGRVPILMRIDFLERTWNGDNNILHIAARAGQKTFVAEALKRSPFLSDQVNREGDTPLMVAARFGHVEVVEVLAKPANEAQMQDDHMATAVVNGTNSSSSRGLGDIEVGRIDGQLEQDTIQDTLATVGSETNSSIHQLEEEEGPLDNHLEHGETNVETDFRGEEAGEFFNRLHNELMAARSGIRLRDWGQGRVEHQWRLKNLKQDTTALHEALRNRHQNVAQCLFRLFPEMATLVNGAEESPLYLAAESGCEAFMMDVLRSKKPYSTKGPHGQNVLHAARYCNDKIFSTLVRDENQYLTREKDNCGKAPIHHAVEADYGVWFGQLLKAGEYSVLVRDNEGYTPFLRASSRGCWDMCKEMLKVFPEVIEARNNKGQHALHLAKAKIGVYPPEMMELVNLVDDEGDTPLHLAVKENQYQKAISLTSSASINLGAVNKGGLTALDLCESDCQHITRKRLMWHHLMKLGAPRGRHPNEHQVPVGGPKGVIRSPDEDANPMIGTLATVAVLLATLTFTAAFTMPGGYDSSPDNLGGATLAKKAALKVFILSDTLAMCCSIHALFLLLHAMRVERDVAVPLRNTSRSLLLLALYATLVAFMSGVFAVIAHKALWVAILVCVLCSAAPYFVLSSTAEKLPHLMPTIPIKAFQWTKSERMQQYIGRLPGILPPQIPSFPIE